MLCEFLSSNGRHSAEKIEKMCPWGATSGVPRMTNLKFFEVTPNGSGIAQVYLGDSLEVYLSSAV